MESTINWLESNIIFDLSSPLPADSMNPSHRYQTEQHIESRAAQLITQELGYITVDSRHLMSDLIYMDPLFYTTVENRIAGMNKTFSRSSADMKHFMLRYTMDFYPFLVELFINSSEPEDIDFFRPLDYHREEFTGILIYAQDSYNIHGSHEEGSLTPALFPRILDPQLNVVYEMNLVDPEFLSRWGMVRYSRSHSSDSQQWLSQIGNKPLQISARAIYGKNQTDIILSQEDCRLILANEADNHLLREGRVLILLPREE